MAKLIGLKGSDFDPARYLAGFGRNCREGEITTEVIVQGVNDLDAAFGARLAEEVKRSPLYLRKKQPAP